jgi:hypothetical protein
VTKAELDAKLREAIVDAVRDGEFTSIDNLRIGIHQQFDVIGGIWFPLREQLFQLLESGEIVNCDPPEYWKLRYVSSVERLARLG